MSEMGLFGLAQLSQTTCKLAQVNPVEKKKHKPA